MLSILIYIVIILIVLYLFLKLILILIRPIMFRKLISKNEEMYENICTQINYDIENNEKELQESIDDGGGFSSGFLSKEEYITKLKNSRNYLDHEIVVYEKYIRGMVRYSDVKKMEREFIIVYNTYIKLRSALLERSKLISFDNMESMMKESREFLISLEETEKKLDNLLLEPV